MSEFWQHERGWAFAPRPVWWRRLLCRMFGHWWEPFYWAGAQQPHWPWYEYCERCWRMREPISEEDESDVPALQA